MLNRSCDATEPRKCDILDAAQHSPNSHYKLTSYNVESMVWFVMNPDPSVVDQCPTLELSRRDSP
jgi:hypothetical protein